MSLAISIKRSRFKITMPSQILGGIRQPEIGKCIRQLRRELDMTQEQFAAELGVVYCTINRWENGHAQPSRLALKQIERMYHQFKGGNNAKTPLVS